MGRKGSCSHFCRHYSHGKEADSYEKLFRQDTGTDFYHALCGFQRRPYFLLPHIRNTDKVPLAGGYEAHDAAHHAADYRGDGRSRNSQRREAEMPLYQQIVKNNIYHIGRHIGFHGNFCISGPPLCRVNHQRDNSKNNESHNDSEILHGLRMGSFLRTAQPDDRICKSHADQADRHRHHQNKHTRRAQNLIGAPPVLLPLASGNQCGYRYIHRNKHGKSDKFRLGSQPHRSHRMRAHAAYHQRVHHSHKRNKKRLQYGRPCHFQHRLYIFLTVLFHLLPPLSAFRRGMQPCVQPQLI